MTTASIHRACAEHIRQAYNATDRENRQARVAAVLAWLFSRSRRSIVR